MTDRPYPATRRQQDVLRFLAGFQEAHDRTPSVREIARGIGSRGFGHVAEMLNGLQDRGYLRIHSTCRRTGERAIDVLHPPLIPRAPDGAPLFFVPVEQPEGD